MQLNSSTKIVVGIFITVILGAILISEIADAIWENRNTFVMNQTVDLETARDAYDIAGDWSGTDVGSGCNPADTLDIGVDVVAVSSVTTLNHTTLTEGTDYGVDLVADEIYFYPTHNINTTDVTNSTYVVGTMSSGTYVKDSSARTLLSLVVILFALGIALFAIGAVIGWGKFKDMFGL